MKSAVTNQPILSEEGCFAKLSSIHQVKILHHWKTLSIIQKERLRSQITDLDIDFLHKQQLGIKKKSPPRFDLNPPATFFFAGNSELPARGKEIVAQGKSAVIVLAGGQGSRLQFPGPKGCFAVTLTKKKSLFQLLAEKVKAAGKVAQRELQVALMTSPLNHSETLSFFSQNDYFGLAKEQISFFQQRMWPLLTLEGELFLEEPGQIAYGPNGNGGVFRQFVEAGLWEQWHRMGIEYINVIPIDNPLADPFDYELLAFQEKMGADLVIKGASKLYADENVGVLAEVEGTLRVIEYFEMTPEERGRLDADSRLEFNIANLGLYGVTMEWLKQISQQELSFHIAKKRVTRWENQQICNPAEPNAWKFEEFIFDLLPWAKVPKILIYPRASAFAPLKNLTGEDSIQKVQKALLKNDTVIFKKITGSDVPRDFVFELSPQFYYPTAALLEKWKGKPFPNKEYLYE